MLVIELGQMMQLPSLNRSSKKRKAAPLVIYRTITIDKCIGHRPGRLLCPQYRLYKLHKTANNVLVPWSIFPLRVLSPEKYVTISVRTQQSNGKAIGHGSFFLRRPKNSQRKFHPRWFYHQIPNNSCAIGYQGWVFIAYPL